MGVVPFISGCGGSTVTVPCQVPATVFSSENDFCADRFSGANLTVAFLSIAVFSAEECSCDWAYTGIAIKPTTNIVLRALMLNLLLCQTYLYEDTKLRVRLRGNSSVRVGRPSLL